MTTRQRAEELNTALLMRDGSPLAKIVEALHAERAEAVTVLIEALIKCRNELLMNGFHGFVEMYVEPALDRAGVPF